MIRPWTAAVSPEQAALAHAFGPMGLTRLVSYTDPANDRAARVCGRLGATPAPDLLDGAQIWTYPSPFARRAS